MLKFVFNRRNSRACLSLIATLQKEARDRDRIAALGWKPVVYWKTFSLLLSQALFGNVLKSETTFLTFLCNWPISSPLLYDYPFHLCPFCTTAPYLCLFCTINLISLLFTCNVFWLKAQWCVLVQNTNHIFINATIRINIRKKTSCLQNALKSTAV